MITTSTIQGRIMVVEDEPDLLRMVEIYLRRWGFTVDGFNNPLEALANFKNNHEQYSLVLTDVRMPDMTGFELATALLKIKPAIKIVIMTAFDVMPRDLETLLPIIKYDDLLIKPFRLVEICNAVKKQLQPTH
jgi:two-component system cell cycle sensor histidine kinase/response regulator CckA